MKVPHWLSWAATSQNLNPCYSACRLRSSGIRTARGALEGLGGSLPPPCGDRGRPRGCGAARAGTEASWAGERVTEHVALEGLREPRSALAQPRGVCTRPPSVLSRSPCSGILRNQVIFPNTPGFTRNFGIPPSLSLLLSLF